MEKLINYMMEKEEGFVIPGKQLPDYRLFSEPIPARENSVKDRAEIIKSQIIDFAYEYMGKIPSATGAEIVELVKEFECIKSAIDGHLKTDAFFDFYTDVLNRYDAGLSSKWDVIQMLM